ncbi:MAG: alpha/beta hydrolase [Elusimicrobia bacterium]|nr:alpha/beta hydrolase [Elusimicrobiota bacterium]
MILQKSEFRLIDRGYKESIVLIPGWAFDYRIFNSLNLDFNYIVPVKFSPYGFIDDISDFLISNKLSRVSIFGWSMGAFIAAGFASKYPEKVQEIIFVSAKERYEKESIARIKNYIKKNKNGYLYKFYIECFSKKEEKMFDWFRKNLLKSYYENMELNLLLEGLDYLLVARIDYETLKDLKIKFIHGNEDRIVPVEEVLKIKNSLPDAEYEIIECAGHLPWILDVIPTPACHYNESCNLLK